MKASRQTGEETTKTPACYHSNLSKATKMIEGVENDLQGKTERIILCVERRRLKGHVITAFQYVKGCSKEKYNSCSPCPLGIKQEIIGLNCTEGD